MSHVKALLIKFVMIAAVLGIVMTGVYGADFKSILLISAVLTVSAYILGDLLIFRPPYASQFVRNLIATVSDAGLAFLIIWFMGSLFLTGAIDIGMASFVSALIIAVGEWFFHLYLDKHIFNRRRPFNK